MNFLHIGGGAGDLDPSTNFRDGFSEFVKTHKSKNKNIFVIEANPINIRLLKKSWENYASVKVFNVAGQLVDVIAEGNYSPSSYNWTWKAENLASGVYFISTEVNSEVSTQKVMLLK